MFDKKSFKKQLLDDLYAPYKNCTLCPLGGMGRKNVVFGRGNPDANLLFIGEGPGRDEDEQGSPFVGRSGRLLSKTLDALGIDESEVYITNIVKCRPPNNRAPLPHEASICTKLLLEKQLQIIRPEIVCTLGASALQSFLGEAISISKARGIMHHHKNLKLFPTFHPAYILRNGTKLKEFAQDIQTANNLSLRQIEL